MPSVLVVLDNAVHPETQEYQWASSYVRQHASEVTYICMYTAAESLQPSSIIYTATSLQRSVTTDPQVAVLDRFQ